MNCLGFGVDGCRETLDRSTVTVDRFVAIADSAEAAVTPVVATVDKV